MTEAIVDKLEKICSSSDSDGGFENDDGGIEARKRRRYNYDYLGEEVNDFLQEDYDDFNNMGEDSSEGDQESGLRFEDLMSGQA